MNTYTDTPNNIVYKVEEGLKKKNQVSVISMRFKKQKNKNLLEGGGSAKVHTEESATANKD